MNTEATFANAEWLRDFSAQGGIIRGADLLLIADIIEMLAHPTVRVRGSYGSQFCYPEYRVLAYHERLVKMFKNLPEPLED